MHILIIPPRSKKTLSLHMTRWHGAGALLLLAFLFFAFTRVGIWWAEKVQPNEFEKLPLVINNPNVVTQTQIDSLIHRIALLQARLVNAELLNQNLSGYLTGKNALNSALVKNEANRTPSFFQLEKSELNESKKNDLPKGGPLIPLLNGKAIEDENLILSNIDTTLGQLDKKIAVVQNKINESIVLSSSVHASGHFLSFPLNPKDYIFFSSGYGPRDDPFTGAKAMHPGIDLVGPTHSPIYSLESGQVKRALRSPSYGWMVEVDHGNGLSTLYAHLTKISVHGGDFVSRGQEIGTLGSSGRSTGPHLHIEVRKNGRTINPTSKFPVGFLSSR